MDSNINFNTIMLGSTFPATDSSVLNKYLTLKNKQHNQKKGNLTFPNLLSGTMKLSRRRVHKKNIIEENKMKKNDIKLNNKSTNLLFLNENNDDEIKVNVVDYDDNRDNRNTPVEIKYSWQDLVHWIPPSEKKKIAEARQNFHINDKEKDIECKIKYSWQVVGLSSQTSNTFIGENNLTDNKNNYKCCIKYSWQIIGIGTQASLHDVNTEKLENDYWNGKILTPNQFKCISNIFDDNNNGNNVRNLGGYNKNKNCILYCEITQTTADKCLQTEFTDCRMDKHIFKMLLNVDFTKKNVLIPIFERNECWEVLNNASDDEGPLSTDDSCQIKYMKRDEKKKELSHRFDLAQSKIQRFDIAIDDISRYISQINEEININISINNKNKHSSMNIQSDLYPGVSHTRKYIEELEERLKSFDIVENEIADSTERVLKEIDCTYDRLVNQVIREINHKRDLMKLEAEVFRKETIAPVKASKKEIKKQILNENRSIVQVKKLLNDPTKQNVTESDVEEIFNSNRNIEGIPVLPQIQESPHVALKPPTDSLLHDVLCKVYDFGSIIRTGPIKIINIEEKPASAFVEWVITDPEYAGGEHTYVLQKANGAVNDPTSDKFETIYRGPETYAFIRDLLVGEPITLRVGIVILESTWSPPRFFKTNIPNYRWSNKNKNYIIENQMARKISDNISTLFSHEPQVDSNQIIEFKFLGASKNENNDEGIALIVDPKDKDDNLQRNGALMISTNGKIFMDGNEKLMQLPQIKLGTKIIFTIMRKKNADLRINIECDDKAVTYDWSVKTPLYFAARFSGDNKWHLMVK